MLLLKTNMLDLVNCSLQLCSDCCGPASSVLRNSPGRLFNYSKLKQMLTLMEGGNGVVVLCAEVIFDLWPSDGNDKAAVR